MDFKERQTTLLGDHKLELVEYILKHGAWSGPQAKRKEASFYTKQACTEKNYMRQSLK